MSPNRAEVKLQIATKQLGDRADAIRLSGSDRRNWGCFEVYTTISGLPHLLAAKLKEYPGHELATAPGTPNEKALSLRGRAQQGDPLALEIFDFQARAMGLHIANLTMALDAGIVVIGGGLMDSEATTPEFRGRYLRLIREAPDSWPWH